MKPLRYFLFASSVPVLVALHRTPGARSFGIFSISGSGPVSAGVGAYEATQILLIRKQRPRSGCAVYLLECAEVPVEQSRVLCGTAGELVVVLPYLVGFLGASQKPRVVLWGNCAG